MNFSSQGGNYVGGNNFGNYSGSIFLGGGKNYGGNNLGGGNHSNVGGNNFGNNHGSNFLGGNTGFGGMPHQPVGKDGNFREKGTPAHQHGGSQGTFHQHGGAPPVLAPPNSYPCQDGVSANCKRCGHTNHIAAYKCDTCNLNLRSGDFPSAPPPGNHGASPPGNQQHQSFQPLQNQQPQWQGPNFAAKTAPEFSQQPQYKGGQHQTKGGGKGQIKWCHECGFQNPHYYKWCQSCHVQLSHSGKGNPASTVQGGSANGNFVQQGYVSGNGNFVNGGQGSQVNRNLGKGNLGSQGKGNLAGEGDLKGGKSHGGPAYHQPYPLDPQRFAHENYLYPGRIPRCFEVSFEFGTYIPPCNLSLNAQWKTSCDYLNNVKAMQSKIDNYRVFLKSAEDKLLNSALPAWKHHRELEQSMLDLPEHAKNLHPAPLHKLAELCYDQIVDSDLKEQFQTLMIQILQDGSINQPGGSVTPPDPGAPHAAEAYDVADDDEEMPAFNESFEIPQWVESAQVQHVDDPDEEQYLHDLLEEITPQLPKRQRISGKKSETVLRPAFLKQAAAQRFIPAEEINTASLAAPVSKGNTGKGKGGVIHNLDNPDVISSEEFSEKDFDLSKRERAKLAKDTRRKEALQAASTSSPSQARKSVNKSKKR